MRLPLQTRFATDPNGVRWRVSVRWTPWWPRRRWRSQTADDAAGMGDLALLAPDDLGGCLIGLAVLLVIICLIALLPILLLVLEVAILVVVAIPLFVLLGIAGITSWRIEVELEEGGNGALGGKGTRYLLQTHRGLNAADDAIRELANRIERGEARLRG